MEGQRIEIAGQEYVLKEAPPGFSRGEKIRRWVAIGLLSVFGFGCVLVVILWLKLIGPELAALLGLGAIGITWAIEEVLRHG